MTTITISRQTARPTVPLAKVAGLAYVGAWVVGLAAFGAGPATDASDAELARSFAAHQTASALRSTFIHGVAAVALLGVLVALHRRAPIGRAALGGGVAAVVLSLTQWVLDLLRSLVATGSTVASLVHTIDRLDGLKMFALALMITTAVRPLRRAGVIGRKLRTTGVAAVVALVVSGAAYAAGLTGLMASAGVALVLLLAWVAAVGFALDRRHA